MAAPGQEDIVGRLPIPFRAPGDVVVGAENGGALAGFEELCCDLRARDAERLAGGVAFEDVPAERFGQGEEAGRAVTVAAADIDELAAVFRREEVLPVAGRIGSDELRVPPDRGLGEAVG